MLKKSDELSFLDDGRIGGGARGRPLQYPGLVPAPFRPDNEIGVAADADGIRIRLNICDDFDIVEIRKYERLAALHQV